MNITDSVKPDIIKMVPIRDLVMQAYRVMKENTNYTQFNLDIAESAYKQLTPRDIQEFEELNIKFNVRLFT
jgi:hypothetical protein